MKCESCICKVSQDSASREINALVAKASSVGKARAARRTMCWREECCQCESVASTNSNCQ